MASPQLLQRGAMHFTDTSYHITSWMHLVDELIPGLLINLSLIDFQY